MPFCILPECLSPWEAWDADWIRSGECFVNFFLLYKCATDLCEQYGVVYRIARICGISSEWKIRYISIMEDSV